MKRLVYFLFLVIFGAGALAVSYPNVGLWMSLYFGPSGYFAGVTAITGFIYLLAFLPVVTRPTRAGLVCTVVAVMGIAFGPFLGGAATLHTRLSAVSSGSDPLDLEAPIRVVDVVVDRGLPDQCNGVCAALLDDHGAQAVRYISPREQEKRVFRSDDPAGPVPEAFATYSQDGAPKADVSIEIGRKDGYQIAADWPKYQRWLLKADHGTVIVMRSGAHNRVRRGKLVYERMLLSYQRAIWPAIYAPVTDGWTSGGNDGGIVPLRVRKWTPEGIEVDTVNNVFARARVRVAVAER